MMDGFYNTCFLKLILFNFGKLNKYHNIHMVLGYLKLAHLSHFYIKTVEIYLGTIKYKKNLKNYSESISNTCRNSYSNVLIRKKCIPFSMALYNIAKMKNFPRHQPNSRFVVKLNENGSIYKYNVFLFSCPYTNLIED